MFSRIIRLLYTIYPLFLVDSYAIDNDNTLRLYLGLLQDLCGWFETVSIIYMSGLAISLSRYSHDQPYTQQLKYI